MLNDSVLNLRFRRAKFRRCSLALISAANVGNALEILFEFYKLSELQSAAATFGVVATPLILNLGFHKVGLTLTILMVEYLTG